MAPGVGTASFSVDVAGLLVALTDQFPDPLLCVRELVQNAADAGAQRIEVDVRFDPARRLARLSVRDDGRGMGEADVEGYLTIGFSDKDPRRHRGRFGVGKLSPFALGFERMIVETSDGISGHRIELLPDGSGVTESRAPGPRGTEVRVYKPMPTRAEAERFAERVFEVVKTSCGHLDTPLFVNGLSVNRAVALPTRYMVRFEDPEGSGALGLAAEPSFSLMGKGIVLESGAPILGPDVSYVLDAPQLAPTLSRNAVRRDQSFDALLRAAQRRLSDLELAAAQVLRQRVERLRTRSESVERQLDPDDRAALEWLRNRLLDLDAQPSPAVRTAPVLETADGDLVSAERLERALRAEDRVPFSRIPRTREEIAGYLDRGVPVLLLYRDLEDFLAREEISMVEVDGLDDGVEVEVSGWRAGEHALAGMRPLVRGRTGPPLLSLVALAVLLAFLAWQTLGSALSSSAGSGGAPIEALERGLRSVEAVAPSAVSTLAQPWVWALALLLTGLGAWGILGARRRRSGSAELRTRGPEGRWSAYVRAFIHPVDFWVAKGWALQGAGRSRGAIAGYRSLTRSTRARAGRRLDLDRVELGFVDLVGRRGDPSDARILVRRAGRILLNRNHPTVKDLVAIAEHHPERAHLLLEILLATDPELAKGCDPRQVEWDLLTRAPRVLRGERQG